MASIASSSNFNDLGLHQPSIGEYCLFYKPDVSPLAWPAIMCPDYFAPYSVLKGRPSSPGCFHLIILIKEKLEFCFALTSELQVFEPCLDAEVMDRNRDLHLAFELVYEAMDCGSALQYWEAKTERLRAPPPSHKRERFSDSYELSTSDAQSWKAAKRNRLDKTPDRPDIQQNLSTSPLHEVSREKTDNQRPPPASTQDIRWHFPPVSAMAAPVSHRHPARPAVQSKDVIEGELAGSKEFLELRIGPNKVQHLIPFEDIKQWDHFFNYHHGSRKFDGQNTKFMQLPCLETISPEDFQYAAEFISTRDFGIRSIDDDNRETAIAECIAAWDVADKLCIEEMLEHVLKKSQQAMPWDLEIVTYFAGVVYKTTESLFQCHKDMKDLLSDYIAARYYDLIEQYGDKFTSQMRDIAELERDVFKKLTVKSEQRMET